MLDLSDRTRGYAVEFYSPAEAHWLRQSFPRSHCRGRVEKVVCKTRGVGFLPIADRSVAVHTLLITESYIHYPLYLTETKSKRLSASSVSR